MNIRPDSRLSFRVVARNDHVTATAEDAPWGAGQGRRAGRGAAALPGAGDRSAPDAKPGIAILADALATHRGRIAVVSSFGAEAAVLLAIVAEFDSSIPVLFLDTGRHFPETLAYRESLAKHLGLRDVRVLHPQGADAADPTGGLWHHDPDACCTLRKVVPLGLAMDGFDAWISGRKRYQGATRAALPFAETVDGRLKVNPLADWSAAEMGAEFARRGLPQHPLVAQNYPSIGCAPCTRPVWPGGSARSGRWAHAGKTECGIHRAPARASSQQA